MKAIVISGPESTGKSTLTLELARYYSTTGIPEYARYYIERLNRPYNINDVETIARRQLAVFKLIERKQFNTELIFFDTFLIITKVWFQEVYKLCPIWLHKAIQENKPHLVLLCRPDISWTFDGIRENPERREYLLNCYHFELGYYSINYQFVDGLGSLRLENAISIVNNYLLKA